MSIEELQAANAQAMIPETIVMVIMGVLCIIWMIMCLVRFTRGESHALDGKGMTAHLRCEKCGAEFDLPAEQVAQKVGMVKSSSITRTQLKGPAAVDIPRYTSFAKKFDCPACHTHGYCQVLNIDELQKASMVGLPLRAVRVFVRMAIGCLIVFIIGSIPLAILNSTHGQRVDEILQQNR